MMQNTLQQDLDDALMASWLAPTRPLHPSKSKNLYISTSSSISHDLLHKAKANPPAHRGTAVTNFTDWVFHLQHNSASDRMVQGKQAESSINETRKLRSQIRPSGWELLHRGLGSDPDSWKICSSLKIDGEPLRASPDLVFRDPRTGHVVIIEVKFTHATNLPETPWPSACAQLWAYSKVDDWIDAPMITLVCEAWTRPASSAICTTLKTWHLDGHDAILQEVAGELFQIYSKEWQEADYEAERLIQQQRYNNASIKYAERMRRIGLVPHALLRLRKEGAFTTVEEVYPGNASKAPRGDRNLSTRSFHCFKPCLTVLKSSTDFTCSRCGRLVCPTCGSCGCLGS